MYNTLSNVVEGNYIGTDVTGRLALGNGYGGVTIQAGASKNIIGGTTAAARNLISGNTGSGVHLLYSGTTGNVVEGNYIGTDVTGTVALGNNEGVAIYAGASGNLIGGTTPGAGNLISGNANYGVEISDSGTTSNLVQGNLIGTDGTGTRAVDNGNGGLAIFAVEFAGENVPGQFLAATATDPNNNTSAFSNCIQIAN